MVTVIPKARIIMERKKTKRRYVVILTVFFILQYLIITRFGQYIYGSTLDWESQHYKIPEYFRTLFYSTGDLFPDFAPHLGAGQNIYNLSYYGLFNPVIMLSYLLPFVPMKYYIIVSTLALVYASTLLLYRWLLGHFTDKSAAVTAMLFVLASPVLFHTHRHIMFINYMPFLILALMGVDEYFNKGKKWLISLSVCLVCLMSYFFSIGAIASIVLYGIYIYLRRNEKITFKGFMKDGIKFLLPVFLGILMAAFLLVPTFIALLSGRAEGGTTVDILSLFIPTLREDNILYSTYALGLTSLSIFSLFYCVLKLKRAKRLLGIVLILILIFPIFIYVLNGMMYVNSKVLIPFLPMYMLAVASCMRDMFFRKKADWTCIAVFTVFAIIMIVRNYDKWVLILEFTITILSLVLFNLTKKRRFLVVSTSIVSLVAFFSAQFTDTLVDPMETVVQQNTDTLIEYALENDPSMYRINDRTGGLDIANRIISPNHYVSSIYSSLSNQNYAEFYYEGIGNEIRNRSRGQLSNPFNTVFDLYMGNKYRVQKNKKNTLGYEKVTTDGELTLYKTDDCLPIAYTNDKIMPLEQFEELSYPYNAEALLNYVIVEDAPRCDYSTAISPLDELDYKIGEMRDVSVDRTDDTITLKSKNGGEITLNLIDPIKNKLLFIEFTLDNNNLWYVGDNHISINGNVNKLSYKGWKYHNGNHTFQYTVSYKNLDDISIKLKKGTYVIKDLKLYTADYEEFVSGTDDVCEVVFDKEKTRGDVMEGTVVADSSGYLNMSIPYDKGFNIYIDGAKTEYEMTDTAFIGCKISAGEHKVRIEYTAPFAGVSKVISLASFAVFAVVLWNDVRKRKESYSTAQNIE